MVDMVKGTMMGLVLGQGVISGIMGKLFGPEHAMATALLASVESEVKAAVETWCKGKAFGLCYEDGTPLNDEEVAALIAGEFSLRGENRMAHLCAMAEVLSDILDGKVNEAYMREKYGLASVKMRQANAKIKALEAEIAAIKAAIRN